MSNHWAVNCEHLHADKMIIQVDVTKFKVQPFRSYKICITMEEDYIKDIQMDPVCTHLFSFEKSVPYENEKDLEAREEIVDGIHENDINSVIKHQLDNIENYLKDDSKASLRKTALKIYKEEDLLSNRSDANCSCRFLLLTIISFFNTNFSY